MTTLTGEYHADVSGLLKHVDALAQQLAASQKALDHYLPLLNEVIGERDSAQATITRLEAKINKALDLDYQRRQEIAEARAVMRDIRGCHASYGVSKIDAFLFKYKDL